MSDSASFVNISFDSDLPIVQHQTEIEDAIRKNPVVIVCGDTGSGKTTQLPKMALAIGRAANGKRIACTQPRRIAAVTIARRVAEEFHEEVGQTIGFQHRFERKTSSNTRIKFLTDGVLLAETRSDPLLRAYDTIIIDEAHERSLNIDFLLGILKRILLKRKDLKVIISSATLDSSLFSSFFSNAPALSIPGRLFPVTLQYMPPLDDEESDLARDVVRAVNSLPDDGDILVFLPGERDIRESASALEKEIAPPLSLPNEIIPLIASLPASEQQRAFRLSPTHRRIILATNVAETSITIPGIRYVIDSGLARISRYIHRTQVQRLRIEPVSQASANQRAGRCGRLGPGLCIRLFDETDFAKRDAFTAPEILRSSLAGVILTMLDLRLGDITQFPFITQPENSMIREGIRELTELGAITINANGFPTLTPIGRNLASMPVEPRIGRMILAADHEAVLPSILPVAAFMACDDPRRRPVDEREKATQAHAKFKTPDSDFASILKMWQWWCSETKSLSQNQARKLCKINYLSYSKMREWRDLTAQLTQIAHRLHLAVTQNTGDNDAFHRALLSGLLARIGLFDPEAHDYRGARGTRFSPFPGSALFKHPPQWIMAGELVETSRLYARDAAVLNPNWIEPVAGPLCTHSYHSPEWDAEHGFVRATEQVTLYGLIIIPERRCDFSRINPTESRSIFIRRGIIDCTISNPPPALRQNYKLLTNLRHRADKLRRPELFDEDAIADFLSAAIPPSICSATALRKWLWKASPAELHAFRLRPETWLPPEENSLADFPDHITISGVRMSLSYRHSLNDEDDGITCTVRASEASALRNWRADWLVPGAIREKLSWMISCLPSAQRRILSPVEDTVARLMSYLHPGEEPLTDALSHAFNQYFGLRIYPDAWDNIRLPVHFLVRYRIIDDKSHRTIAIGRNLDEVLAKISPPSLSSPPSSAPASPTTPKTSTSWTFGTIPPVILSGDAGWQIRHYPALQDLSSGVSLTSFTDPEKARLSHAAAVARLYVLSFGPKALSSVHFQKWSVQAAFFLKRIQYDSKKMADDLLFAAATEAFVRNQEEIRSLELFEDRAQKNWDNLANAKLKLLDLAHSSISAAANLYCAIETSPHLPKETSNSIRNQLDWLVFPGFLKSIPLSRLIHYPRYLDAIRIRLERATLSPSADIQKESLVSEFWQRYRTIISAKEMRHVNRTALVDFRWMIEEYRVSLFAQELKTPSPISPKRLNAKWNEANHP